MSTSTTAKQAAESLAQSTVPIPVGISGLTFIGITVKDWVLMGTAVLIAFQLVVIAPKACRVIKSGFQKIKQGVTPNGKGK